jgi:hypothetical protein
LNVSSEIRSGQIRGRRAGALAIIVTIVILGTSATLAQGLRLPVITGGDLVRNLVGHRDGLGHQAVDQGGPAVLLDRDFPMIGIRPRERRRIPAR